MRVKWEGEVERPWIGMTSESMTEVEHARAELATTIDALAEKLNIPVQVRRARRRAIGNLRSLRDHHSGVFAMILVGGTVAVGIVSFATIRTLRHR